MNEFFKLLIPQLLEYFKDETKVLDFIPKLIEKQYENVLLEYKKEVLFLEEELEENYDYEMC